MIYQDQYIQNLNIQIKWQIITKAKYRKNNSMRNTHLNCHHIINIVYIQVLTSIYKGKKICPESANGTNGNTKKSDT